MDIPFREQRSQLVFILNSKKKFMHQKFQLRNTVLMLIIVLVAAIRVFNNFNTHITALANYSPLAAMGLFGSAYFKGYIKPYLFSLLAIFLSDLVLFATVYKDYGNGFLYNGWQWVYGAFLLIAICGRLIIKKITVKNIALAIVASVFIHWIVTDFGMWLDSKTYAQTWSGFNACLAAAIPFELRLLIATCIYSVIMFGVFEWIKKKNPALQNA
jgi:uncharacterized protein DUF6580